MVMHVVHQRHGEPFAQRQQRGRSEPAVVVLEGQSGPRGRRGPREGERKGGCRAWRRTERTTGRMLFRIRPVFLRVFWCGELLNGDRALHVHGLVRRADEVVGACRDLGEGDDVRLVRRHEHLAGELTHLGTLHVGIELRLCR